MKLHIRAMKTDTKSYINSTNNDEYLHKVAQ